MVYNTVAKYWCINLHKTKHAQIDEKNGELFLPDKSYPAPPHSEGRACVMCMPWGGCIMKWAPPPNALVIVWCSSFGFLPEDSIPEWKPSKDSVPEGEGNMFPLPEASFPFTPFLPSFFLSSWNVPRITYRGNQSQDQRMFYQTWQWTE